MVLLVAENGARVSAILPYFSLAPMCPKSAVLSRRPCIADHAGLHGVADLASGDRRRMAAVSLPA